MLTLSLESATETIDLNSIMDTDEGAQAIAGLTGFGLPPVQVQWAEGAGDGAKYRGRRVLPRDIDLPLYFVAEDRSALKDQVAKLSRVMSDEMTLRLKDFDDLMWTTTEWVTTVARVGGGDITYGSDTTGDTTLSMVVSLRAGDPFWTKDSPESVTQNSTGATTGISSTWTLVNDGTADAYPVWTVTGPCVDFTIKNAAGEQLMYAALVPEGQTITIDTARGTVTSSTGANLYEGLSASPRFFPLKPGSNTITVSMDRSSARFVALTSVGLNRTNYITNPSFTNGTTGWVIAGTSHTYDATNKALKMFKDTGSGGGTPASIAMTGLTVGATYYVHIETSASTSGVQFAWWIQDFVNGGVLGYEVVNMGAGATTFVQRSFIASATNLTFDMAWAGGPTNSNLLLRSLNVVEPGIRFDGATPDTSVFRYDWLGATDASKSTENRLLTPNLTLASLNVAYKPREWMVI